MSNAEIPMNALNDETPDDAKDDAMDVPLLLRSAREQRGEDIGEVADILRIRRTYLEAIEAGNFESLPGSTYTLGFIRSYSEHLGLDGEKILQRFKAQPQGVKAKSELTFPTFVPQHGIPGMAVILIGLIIAGGGYGVWYFMTQGDRFQTELVQPVPTSVAGLPPQKEVQSRPATSGDTPDDAAAQSPSQDNPPSVTTEPSQPAAVTETAEAATANATVPIAEPSSPVETPSPAGSNAMADGPAATATNVNTDTAPPEPTRPEPAAVSVVTAPPLPSPATPASPPVQAPAVPQPDLSPSPSQATLNDVGPSRIPAAPQAPVAFAAPTETSNATAAAPSPDVANLGGDTRIVVNAKVDSWIQIRDDKADRLIMTRLLRRGESYDVPARPGLTLLTGNAGGLEITVDGKSIPALGPIGAVRRHVALDAEKLQNGTAVLE